MNEWGLIANLTQFNRPSIFISQSSQENVKGSESLILKKITVSDICASLINFIKI